MDDSFFRLLYACGPETLSPFSEKDVLEAGKKVQSLPEDRPSVFFRKSGSSEMTMPVAFKISHHPPWEIIESAGDMTAETSEELIAVLSDLIRRQHGSIRFDLSHVRDIDLVSLHILVIFSQKMCKGLPSADLEIIHADDDIRNLLRMTHLDRVYRII